MPGAPKLVYVIACLPEENGVRIDPPNVPPIFSREVAYSSDLIVFPGGVHISGTKALSHCFLTFWFVD
jgi:hypothetical protein